MDCSSNPLLSVVVVIVSDTIGRGADVSHLGRCLVALAHQVDPPSIEVIVPYDRGAQGVEELEWRFSNVTFLPVDDLETLAGSGGSREHHDELRARGVARARGEIIGLIEDHAIADPHWSARVVEAHRQSFAAVGGAIENNIHLPLNWAVYFCDFGRYQNPLPAGPSRYASDVNVSYKRSALQSIRSVWQETFQETAVHAAIESTGARLALSPEIIVYQHRTGLRLGSALRERFIWARSYAATRGRLAGPAKRVLYAALAPALPALMLWRMIANVARKRRYVGPFLAAFPLTTILAVTWSWGEFIGYWTGRADGRRDRPAGVLHSSSLSSGTAADN